MSILSYQREISRQEPLFEAHRAFVEAQVDRSAFLCSGPRLEAPGGVMLVYGDNEQEARETLERDPFVVEGVATYELIQFKVGLADPASSLAAEASR